jgi:diguanylate cyclase (GGDEF)-like protein
MSVQRREGARRDDQYYWLTAFLAAAGMRTAVSRTIAAIILTLGVIPLILMLTPQGPRGLSSQLLAVGVAVGCGLMAWRWLRPWWPTSTESKLCGVAGAACIAVACLIQANPLVGLLGATAFAVLNGIAALLHSGRLLLVTATVTGVTVAVLAVRLAETDAALAVGGVVIVVVSNVFVVVAVRMAMRLVEARVLVPEIEPLTGLFTRRAFDEQFAKLIGSRSRDDDRYLIVLVANLDGFSVVTDMGGAAAPNRARVAVGQRLRETVRRDALVAHVGDAEFLVADLFPRADPSPLAERVRGAITSAPLRLSASVGVVSTPLRPLLTVAPAELLDELLDVATAAMNEARREGGNQIRQVVSPALSVLGGRNGVD